MIPDFTTEPAGCPVSVIHTGLNPNEASELITFEAALNKFKFGMSENVAIAGYGFIDYTVTVTALLVDDNGNFLNEAISSFNLRVKNPCVDPDYVGIHASPLPSKVYTLGSLAPAGLMWEHAEFFESHSICGPITYQAVFLDQNLSISTLPLKYDSQLKKFTLFTEDIDLIGIHELVVSAFYSNYPNSLGIQTSKTAIIEIISPCSNVEMVKATAQLDPPFYYY